MMDDLRELYQEVILDHSKRPRNFRTPEGSNASAEGYNPLCGDKLTLHLVMDGETVVDVGFEGSGCAISTASASTMTESIKGKTRAEIEEIFGRFRKLVTGEASPSGSDLGKLAVFGGVAEFPMRVKCATLCWHTLQAALEGEDESVTTE